MEVQSTSNASGNLPQIGPGRNSALLSPMIHQSQARLNRTFMKEDKRIDFSPPNITAFKKNELGDEGTLFKAKNENVSSNNELILVENRVRAL